MSSKYPRLDPQTNNKTKSEDVAFNFFWEFGLPGCFFIISTCLMEHFILYKCKL